jgi:hypothetical protein
LAPVRDDVVGPGGIIAKDARGAEEEGRERDRRDHDKRGWKKKKKKVVAKGSVRRRRGS